MFTILVVEDNPDMRELFCTVLADSGYRAIPAADGLDALKIMEKEYIDLMVADVMMPNMDGYELTKSLRDAHYDLPILIVTAKNQFDDIQLGFHAGTDDYMIKPINVKELVLRVEALLRRAKISSEKKIVVGSTILNYDALTVTIHGTETILPKKNSICCTNFFLIQIGFLPASNSWMKFGECFPKTTSAPSIRISTACVNASGAATILKLLPCAGWATRR